MGPTYILSVCSNARGNGYNRSLEQLLGSIYAPLHGQAGTNKWGLTAHRCPQKESVHSSRHPWQLWLIVFGKEIVLLLYNLGGIQKGLGQLPLVKLPDLHYVCDWEGVQSKRRRRREGVYVHIFHVHPRPSLCCSAESFIVHLLLVRSQQWYSMQLSYSAMVVTSLLIQLGTDYNFRQIED